MKSAHKKAMRNEKRSRAMAAPKQPTQAAAIGADWTKVPIGGRDSHKIKNYPWRY